MDAVNWLVHGQHGDAPACASPAITNFVAAGNDEMPNDVRQRLLPYLHRVAGSRSPKHEVVRLQVMWRGALRVFAPRALDAAGLHEHAQRLRSLPDDVEPTMAERTALAVAEEARGWGVPQTARVIETAAEAASRGADARGATCAAWAAAGSEKAEAAWDDYFKVLDAALNAGPQGEPWSADALAVGLMAYQNAGGVG